MLVDGSCSAASSEAAAYTLRAMVGPRAGGRELSKGAVNPTSASVTGNKRLPPDARGMTPEHYHARCVDESDTERMDASIWEVI